MPGFYIQCAGALQSSVAQLFMSGKALLDFYVHCPRAFEISAALAQENGNLVCFGQGALFFVASIVSSVSACFPLQCDLVSHSELLFLVDPISSLVTKTVCVGYCLGSSSKTPNTCFKQQCG